MSLLLVLAASEPCSLGVQDARAKVNEAQWFALGCFGGFVTLARAKVPPPPPEKAGEMEPVEAVRYLRCFNEEARKIQRRAAARGCLLGLPLWAGALYLLLSKL